MPFTIYFPRRFVFNLFFSAPQSNQLKVIVSAQALGLCLLRTFWAFEQLISRSFGAAFQFSIRVLCLNNCGPANRHQNCRKVCLIIAMKLFFRDIEKCASFTTEASPTHFFSRLWQNFVVFGHFLLFSTEVECRHHCFRNAKRKRDRKIVNKPETWALDSSFLFTRIDLAMLPGISGFIHSYTH